MIKHKIYHVGGIHKEDAESLSMAGIMHESVAKTKGLRSKELIHLLHLDIPGAVPLDNLTATFGNDVNTGTVPGTDLTDQ